METKHISIQGTDCYDAMQEILFNGVTLKECLFLAKNSPCLLHGFLSDGVHNANKLLTNDALQSCDCICL